MVVFHSFPMKNDMGWAMAPFFTAELNKPAKEFAVSRGISAFVHRVRLMKVMQYIIVIAQERSRKCPGSSMKSSSNVK